MKINPVKIIKKNPFILSPMDTVTDISFRELCEKNGASYTISELSNIDAIIRDKTLISRYKRGNLKINAVQLFGKNPEKFVIAAKKIENEVDIIDVNFGCPSSSVTGNDSGAALLKDPKNVGEIIEKLVKNINKPITAKIRLGYSKMTYNQIAKEIEDAGATLIAVHGRTARQKYSGSANWNAIKEIYDSSKIPIIGNGDIKVEEDIDKYLNSHCDALMIGRAAIGNPFIFKRFEHYYKTGKKIEFDLEDKKQFQKNLFQEYINNLQKEEFHNINIKIQRQAMWFFSGIIGVKELRSKISQTKNIDEILDIVDKF